MKRDFSLLNEADLRTDIVAADDEEFINPFHDIAVEVNQLSDPVSQFMETVTRPENVSSWNTIEMFLPGLVIHIVPQEENLNMPIWKSWRKQKKVQRYNAFIANRESFTDIIVSPAMFLDHLPWRYCTISQFLLFMSNEDRATMQWLYGTIAMFAPLDYSKCNLTVNIKWR